MFTDSYFDRFVLPEDLTETLKKCRCICYPETKEQLEEMCFGPTHSSRYDVSYTLPGMGIVKEAEVVRCKNGPVVNFMEDYMRPALRTSTATSSPSSARRLWTGWRRSR